MRAIDGDALIEKAYDEAKGMAEPYDDFGTLVEWLVDKAPTIEPEPKWIPCVDGNEPKANAECWISTNAKYVRRASYAPKANNQPNAFIVSVGIFGFYEYVKSAKAWMPYTKEPEPYQEEGD